MDFSKTTEEACRETEILDDPILQKFDRGEDILDYCDLSAGVMKMPG